MKCLLVAVTVVALVAFMTVDAQVPSCAQNLIGCANYLNATTKPPSSCCDPLEQAVTKQLTCLCNLYNDPGLLASFGINVTQALGLPGLCGIPGNIVACTGSPTSSPPTPKTESPPTSNVGRTASTGISGLLLIWISMMF